MQQYNPVPNPYRPILIEPNPDPDLIYYNTNKRINVPGRQNTYFYYNPLSTPAGWKRKITELTNENPAFNNGINITAQERGMLSPDKNILYKDTRECGNLKSDKSIICPKEIHVSDKCQIDDDIQTLQLKHDGFMNCRNARVKLHNSNCFIANKNQFINPSEPGHLHAIEFNELEAKRCVQYANTEHNVVGRVPFNHPNRVNNQNPTPIQLTNQRNKEFRLRDNINEHLQIYDYNIRLDSIHVDTLQLKELLNELTQLIINVKIRLLSETIEENKIPLLLQEDIENSKYIEQLPLNIVSEEIIPLVEKVNNLYENIKINITQLLHDIQMVNIMQLIENKEMLLSQVSVVNSQVEETLKEYDFTKIYKDVEELFGDDMLTKLFENAILYKYEELVLEESKKDDITYKDRLGNEYTLVVNQNMVVSNETIDDTPIYNYIYTSSEHVFLVPYPIIDHTKNLHFFPTNIPHIKFITFIIRLGNIYISADFNFDTGELMLYDAPQIIIKKIKKGLYYINNLSDTDDLYTIEFALIDRMWCPVFVRYHPIIKIPLYSFCIFNNTTYEIIIEDDHIVRGNPLQLYYGTRKRNSKRKGLVRKRNSRKKCR